MVKRINHLEATNVQLREEATKLRSERTAYRNQIDEETQNVIAEKEAQLMRAETDLARIRNARDELLADQQMRKAAQEQEKTASLKVQELTDAAKAQIASLESEVERLRLQLDNAKDNQPEVDEIPVEELRVKYRNLERQYSMLNTELTSMQTACRKYSSLASQKVSDYSALEEKVARLTAEKSKADQKYFAAMKSKEARDMEVRTLRMQNSKSSDIVSQLKESEAATRSLLSNMEKQVSETREALNTMTQKHNAAQQQLTESSIMMDGLRGQITELKNLSVSKDTALANASSACRQAETEVEGLKATLADTKKSLENWKNKSLGNSSSEYEMLRVSLSLFNAVRMFQLTGSDLGALYGLSAKLQEHGHQDLRARFLPRLCRGAPYLSLSKVPELQSILWQQRLHAHYLVICLPLPSCIILLSCLFCSTTPFFSHYLFLLVFFYFPLLLLGKRFLVRCFLRAGLAGYESRGGLAFVDISSCSDEPCLTLHIWSWFSSAEDLLFFLSFFGLFGYPQCSQWHVGGR